MTSELHGAGLRLGANFSPVLSLANHGQEASAASITLTVNVGDAVREIPLVDVSLQPGEEVRFLGRSKWTSKVLSPLLNSSDDTQRTVQVGAWFRYHYPPDVQFNYRPSESSELLPVQLRGKLE